MRAATQPWWTDADQAEQDLLVWTLIDELDRHTCPQCDGVQACPGVTRGIQLVIDWTQQRQRASLAAWLRARQTARERHLEVAA